MAYSTMFLRKLVFRPTAVSPSCASRLFNTKSGIFVDSITHCAYFVSNLTTNGTKDYDDIFKIWIGLPGLTKEDIKLTVNKNTIFMKFDVSKNSNFKDSGLDVDMPLPPVFKLTELKAEVKNGMLALILPKI